MATPRAYARKEKTNRQRPRASPASPSRTRCEPADISSAQKGAQHGSRRHRRFPDGNAQKYEQVTGKLFPEGKLPEGWQVHIAGPAGNGWQVVNVVPSQEQFETFAREQLLPAAQQAGDAPPQITFFPVYRLIRT